jgi:hypothetical protein
VAEKQSSAFSTQRSEIGLGALNSLQILLALVD